MRLIDADSALDALREVIVPAEDIGFGDELTDGYNDGINMAVTVVSGLPTVDAVPVVHSFLERGKDGYMRCHNCGSRASAIKARYCHHCGAKMDGKDGKQNG